MLGRARDSYYMHMHTCMHAWYTIMLIRVNALFHTHVRVNDHKMKMVSEHKTNTHVDMHTCFWWYIWCGPSGGIYDVDLLLVYMMWTCIHASGDIYVPLLIVTIWTLYWWMYICIQMTFSLAVREHQRQGVQFMFDCVTGQGDFNGNGCILADDVSLVLVADIHAYTHIILTFAAWTDGSR